MFDYITVAEIDKYTFYRIPKLLITDDKFKSLSCESKLLYGLLIDRASLSKKYNWIDDDGKIYVYFRQEEAQEMLNMASGKAVKIFKELDTFGLIIRIKQGQGKPTAESRRKRNCFADFRQLQQNASQDLRKSKV